jgi:hypothetical protein
MEGNPFLNFFWLSVIQLPAYIMGKYLGKSTNSSSLINISNIKVFISKTMQIFDNEKKKSISMKFQQYKSPAMA